MFFGGEGQVWELHPDLIRLNFLTDRIWDPGPSFTDRSGFRKRIQIRGYKTHFFLLHHKLSVFNVQSCILIDEQIKNGQTVLKYCLLKY